MSTPTWTVAEAKAKSSQVIDQAQKAGPQTITRSGKLAAVVVSAEEWERKTRRSGNLAEFFAQSPLRASGLRLCAVRAVRSARSSFELAARHQRRLGGGKGDRFIS